MTIEGITRRLAGAATAAAAILAAALAAAPAAAETTFVVQAGSPAPNVYYIPYMIAQQMGFFKREGLSVEIRYSQGAPLAAQIVASGGANVGSLSIEPLILGYAKGLRGRAVYQATTQVIYSIALPQGSPLTSAADLKGRKIGVASTGSAAIPVARAILREAGADPTSVQFLPVGAGAQALAALNAGQVDALALWDAPYAAFEATGHHFTYLQDPKLKDVGNQVVFASEATIAQHPRELAGFLRATAEATLFGTTNPEAAVRMFWRAAPSAKRGGDDAEALAIGLREWAFMQPSFDVQKRPDPRYGAIHPDQMQIYIDVLAKEANLASPPTASEIVTEQFIEAANAFDKDAIRRMAREWKP